MHRRQMVTTYALPGKKKDTIFAPAYNIWSGDRQFQSLSPTENTASAYDVYRVNVYFMKYGHQT